MPFGHITVGVNVVFYMLMQIIMPGYCVAGTVGWKILNGQRRLEFDNKQVVWPSNKSICNIYIGLPHYNGINYMSCTYILRSR